MGKAVRNKENKIKIVTSKYDRFSYDYIEEYKKMFKELCSECIKDSYFDDDIWLLADSDNIHMAKVEFKCNEFEFKRMQNVSERQLSYQEFKLAYKCFIIINLKYYSLDMIRGLILALNKLIEVTNYFDDSYIELLYQINQEEKTVANYVDYYNKIIDFGEFYSNSMSENMILCLSGIYESFLENYETLQRKIPSFQSLYKFQEILYIFTHDANEIEKLEYYPLLIWWKITTIIPIRTTELTITPKCCLDAREGKYFIKLRRSNEKGVGNKSLNKRITNKGLDAYYLHELEVNEEIYRMINKYYDIVDKYDYDAEIAKKLGLKAKERDYIFSYNSKAIYNKKIKKNNRTYFSSTDLQNLLKRFFAEVISDRYGFDVVPKGELKKIEFNQIEIMQPMDTRHIAFMNLVLQGVEPIIIKEIGGHKNINSSYNYYNHLPQFVECYTFNLAKKIASREENNQKRMIENPVFLDSSIELKYAKTFRDVPQDARRRNGGWCTSKNWKKQCAEHLFKCSSICKAFIPDDNGLNKIYDDIELIKNNITIEIEVLKSIVKSITINHRSKSDINLHANRLKAFINQHALILSESILTRLEKENE